MYCVIQRIEKKSFKNGRHSYNSSKGYPKRLEVSPMTMTFNGVSETSYSFYYSVESFERTNKNAYKISIHNSYRENGKVKKKQWVICTLSYYDIVAGYISIWDYIYEFADKIGIEGEELYNIVNAKLDPLKEELEREFAETEEYKTHQEHERITTIHAAKKVEFENKYGKNLYDKIYDVFGTLRNKDVLDQVKENYKKQQEYNSRYYEDFKSNYSNDYNSNSSMRIPLSSYSDDEMKILKKLYKTLAINYHPDKIKGTGEEMKLINKLKEQWGI